MNMKMQIHAKEDSYAKVKVTMVASEQEQKKFCTKEIKPTGSGLSRNSKRHWLAEPCIKTIPQPNAPKSFNRNKYVKSPEILKQSIRDRIIHILAIRPYKKPEVLLRLISEGMKGDDRKLVPTILPQVSTVKENVYILAHNLWKEVQEDWKFCSEEELEILRKRKQKYQNSKRQLESSSLPPIVPPASGLESHVKKRRISHIHRENPSGMENSPDSSIQINGKFSDYDRPTSTPNNEYPKKKQKFPKAKMKNGCSPIEKSIKFVPATNSHEPHVKEEKTYHYPYTRNDNSTDNSVSSFSQMNGKCSGQNELVSLPNDNRLVYVRKQHQFPVSEMEVGETSFMQKHAEQIPSTSRQKPHTKEQVTSNCTCEGNCTCVCNSFVQTNTHCMDEARPVSSSNDDYHDCIKEYSVIESAEQRALYKADFIAQYEEYISLYSKLKCVSEKITSLVDHFNSLDERTEEFKKSRWKTYKICEAYQQNQSYMDALKRFKYLQFKLSHIKRLVIKYDSAF